MRRIAISVVAALLAVSALAPVAAADEWPPPGFVAPCADGATWNAEPGQPLDFHCGWAAQTYGQMRSFLTAVVRSFTITDEAGVVVLSVDPAEAATGWWEPERLELEGGEVTCASRWGWVMPWRYESEGLEAGIYTVSFTEAYTHPVNDGYHTCWWDDGTRLSPPPSLYREGFSAVSTLVVE